MKFASLKEMMQLRRLCPLCQRPMNYGFQVVNGRAFIKYSQRTSDIFMNVDVERNWVTYNSYTRTFNRDESDRPSFRNLTRPRDELGALNAICRTPVNFKDGEPAKFNEYSFNYDITLNHMKNRVEQISVTNETFKLLDGYSQYDIWVRHAVNEVSVSKLAEYPGKSIIEKYPITYFSNMTTPTRESLLRKVKTIRVFKEQ